MLSLCFVLLIAACAPRVVKMAPLQGTPGTIVSLEMEYLVGWPRVEIGTTSMNFHDMKLSALDPKRQDLPGEDLAWIEDKILQFRVPNLAPGDYTVTIHDDKGPPGKPAHGFLETAAYLLFPPVWPFVLRSNHTQATLRILPP